MIWRRLNETAQGQCARGRQHPGVRGVQHERAARPLRAPAASARSAAQRQRWQPRKGELKLGVTLPLSGGAAADGQPTLKGAQLAIDQINAKGGVGGYTIKLVPLDHAVNGKYNEQQGAQDMQTFVADPAVIGVVGPYNSAVAKVQIPISNAAGLLQCSPANTNETLTKPSSGRSTSARPSRTRSTTSASRPRTTSRARRWRSYAYNNLGLKNMLIVDDVTTFGKGVADNFQKKFEALGGKVDPRSAPARTPPTSTAIITDAKAKNPDGVYYGGVVTSGGGLLLKQLRQQGLTIPFLGPDGIVNGAGDAKGSLIQIAGAEAADELVRHGRRHRRLPGKADFDAAFTEHFKADADFKTPGAYSGPAYACATVILEVAQGGPRRPNPSADQAAIREGVRAYATDPTHSSTRSWARSRSTRTATPPSSSSRSTRSIPAAKGGVGDWVFKEQQNFAAKLSNRVREGRGANGAPAFCYRRPHAGGTEAG